MAHSNIYKDAQERIGSMLDKLNSVLHVITPHLSASTNGLINKLGIGSLLTAGTNSVVTTAIESQDPTWLTISEAVAIVSISGSVMFMVKIGYDMYIARRKDKREQEEHELNMLKARKNELG